MSRSVYPINTKQNGRHIFYTRHFELHFFHISLNFVPTEGSNQSKGWMRTIIGTGICPDKWYMIWKVCHFFFTETATHINDVIMPTSWHGIVLHITGPLWWEFAYNSLVQGPAMYGLMVYLLLVSTGCCSNSRIAFDFRPHDVHMTSLEDLRSDDGW